MKKVLRRHAEMIFDMARSGPLLRAIAKKVRRGDVVADIGCGIGLLSFAAVHAGARRVYAMDVDAEALAFAKWQAKKIGMEKRICFLEEHSQNVELIERADLLIQETVGPLAFDENFIPTLIDAKRRFLKPKGKIIPEELSLYGVLINRKKKQLTPPSLLLKIKTDRPCPKCAKGIQIRKTWRPPTEGVGPLRGVLLWPRIVWAKGCITDCAPGKNPTHWGQTLLPLSQQGVATARTLLLNIAPHPKNTLYYSEIEWQIG